MRKSSPKSAHTRTSVPKPKPAAAAARHGRAQSSGAAAYEPPRGRFTGKGKQKRDVISTTHPSMRRGGRGRKFVVNIPPGVTGTGEQAS